MDTRVVGVVGSPQKGQGEVRPKVRPARTEDSGPWRTELMQFVLETCGEAGFSSTAAERAFHDRLGPQAAAPLLDREGCFAAAYAAEAGMLCDRLMGSARAAKTRREGFESGVHELAHLISERPAVSKSLLAEVRLAGPRAMAERTRLLGELGRALDGSYRAGRTSAAPPPGTAIFILAAIEAIALRSCLDGDSAGLAAMAPELATMVEEAYSCVDLVAFESRRRGRRLASCEA